TTRAAVEEIQWQFLPVSHVDSFSCQRSKVRSLKCDNGGAARGEHASDLVIAPFRQREFGFTRSDEFEVRRGARFVIVVEPQRPAREQRNQLTGYIAIQRGAIDFRHLV